MSGTDLGAGVDGSVVLGFVCVGSSLFAVPEKVETFLGLIRVIGIFFTSGCLGSLPPGG